ncbi:GIY-YIG nuclease family protein [Nonomuraea wenchangensis]|uniref:GIY-YIG nuclease family protein n=1 Tax=Nonomuraea wenchangensis TaxID=568860 RepID=UPI0033234157
MSRLAMIPHPLTALKSYGRRAPYWHGGVRVHRVTCKTGVGASRSRMIPHMVAHAGVVWDDAGTPVFGAYWVCGAGAKDAVFLASADEYGGICERCLSVAAGPCVYRAFGPDGALLYVGSTDNRYLRFKSHEKKSAWWGLSASIECEDFPTIDEARAAEMTAIRTEHPMHNRIGRRSRRSGEAA